MTGTAPALLQSNGLKQCERSCDYGGYVHEHCRALYDHGRYDRGDRRGACRVSHAVDAYFLSFCRPQLFPGKILKYGSQQRPHTQHFIPNEVTSKYRTRVRTNEVRESGMMDVM